MKMYVQLDECLKLIAVQDVCVVGPDGPAGIIEKILVFKTFRQTTDGSGKTGSKLSVVRKTANVKGRGSIMAKKLLDKMNREKV